MSKIRAASRIPPGLTRGISEQCLWKPLARSLATQRLSLSSTALTKTRLRTTAMPSMRNYFPRMWFLYDPASYSPTRRPFSVTSTVAHGDWSPPKAGEELYVTFIDKEGDEHEIAVSKGDNLLDVAQANDIEMEGACGGSCACSTCHVIVEDEKLYDTMEEPTDDENDMLDLAFGLTETSRLGCQILMSKELDGLRVKLPSMTRNMQASDFSKKNERSD